MLLLSLLVLQTEFWSLFSIPIASLFLLTHSAFFEHQLCAKYFARYREFSGGQCADFGLVDLLGYKGTQ